MLASQFLSVVIDEGDAGRSQAAEEAESPSSHGTSEEYGCDAGLIQDLEAVCKLPKVLLAECSISLVSPEDKTNMAPRECRFDAYITPVRRRKRETATAASSSAATYQAQPSNYDDHPAPQNIEELLQGVEAVYSDEEESGASTGKSEIFRRMVCRTCRREFLRRCQPQQVKSQYRNDDYVPSGFQCATCGKVYSQRSVLKKHEAVHSGYRLRCKVCGIDFTQRSSLLRHCKRIHGIASDHDIQTPLVPPDPRQIGAGVKVAPATYGGPKLVPALADRLNALLAKKEDAITLAVAKKPKISLGPYSVDPHTIMTITPDVIIRTEDV